MPKTKNLKKHTVSGGSSSWRVVGCCNGSTLNSCSKMNHNKTTITSDRLIIGGIGLMRVSKPKANTSNMSYDVFFRKFMTFKA